MKSRVKSLPKNRKYLAYLSQLNGGQIRLPEFVFQLKKQNESQAKKYQIKIYYPRQFEAFRLQNKIQLKDFIKSISTTNIWASTGGVAAKSFQKSYDHQYVIKEISKKEFDSFKRYVKEYFMYFFECELDNRPTLITKIFGMYRVHINNKNHYFIVMDNLYFGLDKANLQTYDLKGSQLRRFVSNPKKG
jgi:hypothetical protein